jgi:hypothetical protein
MATILAHIVIQPGKEAEFEALAATLHRASHDTEEHLRAYGYWRGQEARHYYTLLAFDDYVGFLEHQSSDHHEGAALTLRDCIESISLEWVDPVEGASKLVASNPMEAPADASPVMARYARIMPAQVAEWWGPLRAERRPPAG